MKNLKKALCTFLILFSMLFCFHNGLAMADNDLKANIVIDNHTLHLEVPPVNHQGTVMVPMRSIFEALNAKVTWNKEDESIIAIKGNTYVQLFIGSQFAYLNKGAVVLSGVPYINNGNTMVPVRFIAETFGAQVSWNSVDQKVTIVTSTKLLNETEQNHPDSLDPNSAASSATFVPSELRIQFVTSQMAELLLTKVKPLEKMLSEQLEIPVEFSINSDYNNVVKSMKAKTIDLSFLPPSYYIYAHDNLKAADVLLQALRYGVETPTGRSTQELVDFYQAMFLVRADSTIQSIEDLKNKKIGWQSVTSAAGYVYPGYMLLKNGIDPIRNVTGEQFRGHDKAVQGLLNNKVDAVAVFQDIRTNMLKDYPNVMNDTRILAFSRKIPNDTISVRSDMHLEWRKKIQDAFIAIVNNSEGKKVIQDVFSHQGYTVSEDNIFEIVREVNAWLYDELNTTQKS